MTVNGVPLTYDRGEIVRLADGHIYLTLKGLKRAKPSDPDIEKAERSYLVGRLT